MSNIENSGGAKPSPTTAASAIGGNSSATPERFWSSPKFKMALRAIWVIFPFAIVGLWIIFFIQPWDQPAEDNTDDVARAWNVTMRRLDIDPIYPPQEDLSVGDVYLILDPADVKKGLKTESALSGKSIKVATIDIRANLSKRPYSYMFTEGDQIPAPPPNPEPSEVSKAAVPPPIDLSIIAFPGIDVKAFVGSRAGIWDMMFGRRSGRTEDLVIPSAETYSMPVVDAVLSLANFCSAKTTGPFCQDQTARKVLSYAFGEAVNERINGKYTFAVRISVIRQVFLTKHIKSQHYRGDALSAEMAEQKPENSASDVPSKEEKPKVSVAYDDKFSTSLALDQTFSRPVAFGFRQVSFSVNADH